MFSQFIKQPVLEQARRAGRMAVALLLFCGVHGSLAFAQRMAWWEQPENVASLAYVPGQRVQFHFERTATWELNDGRSAFTGVLTVVSEEPGTVSIEQISFELDAQISTAWNATIRRNETGRYTVRPSSWNSTLEQGQARSIGFQGTYEGELGDASDFRMAGKVEVASPAALPVAPGCPLETAFDLKATWRAESNSTGFLAEVYVTNVGTEPSSWLVALDTPADVTSAWNAAHHQISSNSEKRYLIVPEAWNGLVQPGSTVSFTLMGSYSSEEIPIIVAACPELEFEDPYRAAFVREWLALTPERRRAYAAGRLVWNGSDFLVPSPLLRPRGSR